MGDKNEEKKDQKKDDSDVDYRLEFLLNYLTRSMKLKMEKWNKMMQTDEFGVRIVFNWKCVGKKRIAFDERFRRISFVRLVVTFD